MRTSNILCQKQHDFLLFFLVNILFGLRGLKARLLIKILSGLPVGDFCQNPKGLALPKNEQDIYLLKRKNKIFIK